MTIASHERSSWATKDRWVADDVLAVRLTAVALGMRPVPDWFRGISVR
jgi:hypothetical protein